MSSSERLFCRSSPWQWIARRFILPWALQGARPSDAMLEIGGESGAMAEGTARRFPDVSLTLTDIDPAMLAAARRRLPGCARVHLVVAGATQLPFRDQSYDTVASHLMLHHVIDWERAVAEVGRVLRPGGALVGYDLVASRVSEWLHRADGSSYRMIRRGQLEDALLAAGLEIKSIRYGLQQRVVRFTAHKPP